MATNKRKRKPIRTTTNKRPIYTLPDTESSSSSDEEEETEADPAGEGPARYSQQEWESGSQEEWEAERILEQRGQGFAVQYLIEWKGIDPATERQWTPTWVKFKDVSEGLRASWKAAQAQRAEGKKEAAAAARRSAQQRSTQGASRAQASKTRSLRHRRIVESAEPPTSAPAVQSPVAPSQSAAVSSSTATIDLAAPTPDFRSPEVYIDVRGASFNRNSYEPYSEIPESQASTSRNTAANTDSESSFLFASQPDFRASGIVVDSQSSAGDVSYVPVTQEELASSLHSDLIDGSSADDVVGYSGLDTNEARKLGARAHSPATSIAETIADTTQESHSQRQLENQQEQSEIQDTLGSQSPLTSNKIFRTDTQNSFNNHQFDSASRQPHDSAEQQCHFDSLLLFVDNTTQLECGTSASEHQRPSQPPQEQDEHSALEPEPADPPNNTQGDSEPLAVADTPQISSLTSTSYGTTFQEAQLGFTHRFEPTQPIAEQDSNISLTERSVWEENAQFPFVSQHPAFFDPRSVTKPPQRALTEPPRTCDTRDSSNVRDSVETPIIYRESCIAIGSEESTTIDEISQAPGKGTSHASFGDRAASQEPRIQTDDQDHRTELDGDSESVVDQDKCGVSSETPPSTEQSSGSREHNAQLVQSSADLTQDQDFESIRATVETDSAEAPRSKHSSPCSRHDSSQETPERTLQSTEQNCSPIPYPPSFSLRTLDSNIPPRPSTPALSSSLSKMVEGTTGSGAAHVARRIEEIMSRGRDESNRSKTLQNDAASLSNNALILPNINISAEGTRSPSTVPDRSSAPAVPTSLRSVAISNAKRYTGPSLPEAPVTSPKITETGPTEKKDELAAAIAVAAAHSMPAAPPAVPDDAEITNDIVNANDVDSVNDDDDDDDDDDESVYDDELQLDDEEYIVPLFIDGRQRDTYTEYIKQKENLLNEVLVHGPAIAEKLDEVEKVLAYLKGVETHSDLMYAEAESATGTEPRSLADVQHGAQFGIDNSVKFKFLGQLFDRIRDKQMHIVILLEEDNKALINILTTFLIAGGYNFKMPTNGHQSTGSTDSLLITVFSKTLNPVLSPVNLIICLDGVQHAAQARERKAPASGKVIPVLHLVIPQTVGHIERYMVPTAERRDCIETILAGLARMQTRNEVGQAIDIDTPSARDAAQLIASWLCPEEDQESKEWPLPSIGSARSLIEWDETQQSVRSTSSSPAPERTKRPLEDEDMDAAKRMRYTPRLQVAPSSIAAQQPEVTHVSDSMPGTAAAENARLVTSLENVRNALLQERKERREEAVMWDRQQTEHENRQEQYRKLFNEKAAADRALEAMTSNRDRIRGHLDVQSAEIRTLREELEALRALNLASSDAKDVEITRLRKDLEAANLDREKARTSAKSQEETMDFLKEQYRQTQVLATQAQAEVDTLTAQNGKLTHQASDEAAKLKQMHFDRSTKMIKQKNKILQSENAALKAILKTKEEELIRARANSGRAAYGTRGQSTTPQPKTRSRAASPERGARVARGGGRISNLVAEER